MSQDESENVTEAQSDYKPSFTLIAIDTHPAMFIKLENDLTPFELAIRACYEIVDSLIFKQSKTSWTPFCITLALEDSKATLIDFNQNILESIKLLKKESSLTGEELQTKYERQSNLDMAGFFLHCRKRFHDVNTDYYKRNMIYITNNDNPIKSNKEKFTVLNEVKNFEGNDIYFEMITTNANFNYQLFYNELFSLVKYPLTEILIEDGEGMIEKLSSVIVSKYYKRRVIFYPFISRPKMFLKVLQKNYIHEAKLFNNGNVSKDGKMLKKISKLLTDGLESYTYKMDFGSESLAFDVNEYMKTRTWDLQPGYTLIRSNDRVTEIGFNLKEPCLLYPDPKEELKFFDHFWQYCVDHNKVLICVRKLKHLDKIRFVEFIPQLASNVKHFLVKIIPFANEIHSPSKELELFETVEASEEQKKIVQDLVKTLTFEYDPKMLPDPSYISKQAYVKAKLLDENVEDVDVNDVTSTQDGIDKQIEKIVGKFNGLFELEPLEIGTKRKTTSSSGGKDKARKQNN